MTRYLVLYEPPESGCFPSLRTLEEIVAMVKTASEQGGHLHIYRIRRGRPPERMILIHRVDTYWLEDRYGNVIENV